MFPGADPLFVLAVVVAVGMGAGLLFKRFGLASVTGQLLAGLLLGGAGLGVFGSQDAARLQPVTHFALGLITLVVGGQLNVRRLGNAMRRLGWLLLAQVLLTPPLVAGAVVALGGDWRLALLLGVVALETGPATVVAVVWETRSRGIFVKTLLATVALANVACILLFELVHGTLAGADGGFGAGVLLHVGSGLLVAAALGFSIGAVLVALTRHVVRSEALATASLLSVLVALGFASLLDASALLTCLFLGVTLANLTPDKDEIVESAYLNLRGAIFAAFFTLAGMELDPAHLAEGGLIAIAVVAARAAGKIGASTLALRAAGGTEKLRRWLGPALLPQAGVAVGLLLVAREDPALGELGPQLLSIGLAAVFVNEIVGPLLLRVALQRSGELGKDRERLIDFLHEENIVVGLQADTKDEAIRKLVDVLVRTNRLDTDRDTVLASVLEREAQASTCFGSGLAVPHGILPRGERIVGAMGLSKAGLSLDTPDGKPVHCMVVLATPENERGRHLQVLAALAKAVGTDRNVQQQLFNAQSAAHAWEILHAEDAEGFNWFLEDGGGRA